MNQSNCCKLTESGADGGCGTVDGPIERLIHLPIIIIMWMGMGMGMLGRLYTGSWWGRWCLVAKGRLRRDQKEDISETIHSTTICIMTVGVSLPVKETFDLLTLC